MSFTPIMNVSSCYFNCCSVSVKSPPQRNCRTPPRVSGKKIKICPLQRPHRGTHPRHRQSHPGMPHPSYRSRRNRCVQLCLRTSVPGVDVPVQIQENNQSHTRNNPGRNLPGSCRRWQNRLRNSPERHRAF